MIIVVKAGKWIAKHRFIILLLGILLLIPSFIGMAKTRINYDLLSYLPESLETVEGQDVMVDEYGMGAFAMVVVEDTDMKDIQKLADQFNKVDHVEKVLWYGDVADLSLPVEMIPSDLRKAFYNGDATLMLALFDNTTSSDEAMNAVGEMRKIASKQCFYCRYDRCCSRYQECSNERSPDLCCNCGNSFFSGVGNYRRILPGPDFFPDQYRCSDCI